MIDVEYVEAAIHNGITPRRKLPQGILDIEGWSSARVRYMLNELCSGDDIYYLEIGVWQGSTHIAALWGNNVKDSTAIDNFSESWGDHGHVPDTPETRSKELERFEKHCMQELGYLPTLINTEFLDAAMKLSADIYNIYFYDGDHSPQSQEQALTEFIDTLQDTFVYLVDDWNWGSVRDGTYSGIEKLDLTVVKKWELEADIVGDKDKWWNGIGVFLMTKP